MTLAKHVRRRSRLGSEPTLSTGRLLRGVADLSGLWRAIVGASLSRRALVLRAAREGVDAKRAERARLRSTI